MANGILFLFLEAFEACKFWFVSLLAESGISLIFLAGVFIALVGRFLLSPIFGTAAGVFLGNMGSDQVSKHRYNGHSGISGQRSLPRGRK